MRRVFKSFTKKSLDNSTIKQFNSPYISINRIEEHDTSLTEDQKKELKRVLVYRSNPNNPDNIPKFVSYYVDMKKCGPMYLDVIIKIKNELDPTLTFRRACREGVCGSCAMTVDGKTTLACINEIDKDCSKESVITPLGHMYIVKDLVVDMTNFYNQYRSIEPFLKLKTPKKNPNKEIIQNETERKKLDGLYECVLCASCSTSCPSYWWKPDAYLGPAVLMQAYRWIIDSRDEFKQERLAKLAYEDKADACQNIGMCSSTCPKGLDPRKVVQSLLDMLKEDKLKRIST